MRKLLPLLLFIPLLTNGQSLFKGLNLRMSKKDAKKEYKLNKSLYNNIDIGNGWVWRTTFPNLTFGKDGLKGIYFYQKGTLLSGMGYDNTVSCLNMTKQFFEDLGYTEFYKNKWWNAPLNFSHTYGLIMVSSDKAKIAHLFPTKDAGGNNNHTAGLILFDYKKFIDSYNKRKETIEKKQKNSGF
jgi:hypothetical protein